MSLVKMQQIGLIRLDCHRIMGVKQYFSSVSEAETQNGVEQVTELHNETL